MQRPSGRLQSILPNPARTALKTSKEAVRKVNRRNSAALPEASILNPQTDPT